MNEKISILRKYIDQLSGRQAFGISASILLLLAIGIGFSSLKIQFSIMLVELIYFVWSTKKTVVEDSAHISFSIFLMVITIIGLILSYGLRLFLGWEG